MKIVVIDYTGQIPGRTQGGRHGMVFAMRPSGTVSSSSTNLVPGTFLS